METFKPVQPSFAKKFFGSTFFQVSILFLITFGVAFFLYNRQHQGPRKRVTYSRNIQINSTDHLPSNKAITEVYEDTSKSLDQNPTAATEIQPEIAAPVVAAATPLPTPKETKAPSFFGKKNPTIRVVYAEVSRSTLQSIYEDSQATEQFLNFKDYSAGILPQIERKLSGNSAIKILHREEYSLEVGKNLQWFYGLKDRNEPDLQIGLTTSLELSESDGTTFRGNIDIQRSWRDAGGAPRGGVQKRSFPAIFELTATSGFFISGVMPHRSNLENDDELTAIDIYKILKSEDFLHDESEFVIFVELGNPSAK